jgi:hypothetical protein
MVLEIRIIENCRNHRQYVDRPASMFEAVREFTIEPHAIGVGISIMPGGDCDSIPKFRATFIACHVFKIRKCLQRLIPPQKSERYERTDH